MADVISNAAINTEAAATRGKDIARVIIGGVSNAIYEIHKILGAGMRRWRRRRLIVAVGRVGRLTDTIIVALIAFVGTMVGSISGVLATAKNTEWRLKQLEIKVDKHNTLVERMTRCESDIGTLKVEVGRHGAD